MTEGPASAVRRFDIDPVRGIVCLSLVFLHFCATTLGERFMRFAGQFGQDLMWRFRPGVECFFVLAGFLLAHTMTPSAGERLSVGGYLKRRFLRLVLPFWIAIAIAAVNHWLPYVLGKPTPGPGVLEFASQLVFLDAVFGYDNALIGYWSMVTLEQFYLMWLLLFTIAGWVVGRSVPAQAESTTTTTESTSRSTAAVRATRHETVMTYLTALMAVASVAWILWKWSQGDTRPDQTPRFMLSTKAFLLADGMLIYWAVRRGFGYLPCFIGLAATVTAAVLVGDAPTYKALVMCLVLVPLSRGWEFPRVWAVQFLHWIGRRSYSIYLMHGLVVERIALVERKVPADPAWLVVPLLLVGMAASVVLALVFYRFVERPCHEWARRISYRRQPAPPVNSTAIMPAPAGSA